MSVYTGRGNGLLTSSKQQRLGSADALAALWEVGLERDASDETSNSTIARAESIRVLEFRQGYAADDPANQHVEVMSQLENETLTKFRHRVTWLVVLLILQSLSSIVLKFFEDLILQRPVIILFLTMLVGAGGNAGSQSTVLAIRELARGRFYSQNLLRNFIRKELCTGIKLALVLTLISFLRVYSFNSDVWEVLAISTSMFAIVLLAVAVGTLMPLLLWKCGWDPAHASAAIQVSIDILGVSTTCFVSTLIFRFVS